MINERVARIVFWILAAVVPGGLALLALWASARAIKNRLAIRAAARQAASTPSRAGTASASPRLLPAQADGRVA